MNIKDLKHLLNVTADAESNGDVFVLLASDGSKLSLSYKREGVSVTSVLPCKGKKFLVKIELLHLQNAIADFKNTDDLKLNEEQGDLIVVINRDNEQVGKIKISSPLKAEVSISADDFIPEYESFELDFKQWKYIDAMANIMAHHQSEVKALEIYISGSRFTIKGMVPEFICQRSFELKQAVQTQRFVLPISIINLVGIFKPERIGLKANKDQVMIDLGNTFIMSEPISNIDFPVFDGLLTKNPEQEISATIDRKSVMEVVQRFLDSGAKKITLVFGNQNIVVKSGKQSESLSANTKNSGNTSITIATNVLLAVLGSISNAKVIFLLPFAGASSLIVEVVSGLMFIVAVAAKQLKKVANNALDVIKSEPEREILQSGKNSDGSTYVVEAVEQPAVIDSNIGKYSSQLNEVIQQVDNEIKMWNENLAGEYLPERSQEIIDRKNQLISLKETLTQIINENKSSELVEVDESYPLSDLQSVKLRFQWAYSRALEIAFQKEKEWRFYIRFIKAAA